MEKNTLYEILEVSENASAEIIEKAYKVLAKKYHPDLQEESQKANSENKMKQINEAYEILGNSEKRKEYDITLKKNREEEKLQNNIKVNYNNDLNCQNESQDSYIYEKERQIRQMQENLNKQYENAYYNYLRSLGYKVKHKLTKQNIIDFIIVIGIMAIIIVGLWYIPFTRNWMINFYKSNPILKVMIDIIISIITGIFKGIWTFIKGIFE